MAWSTVASMGSREEYIRALEKLKGRDRLGMAGQIAATGTGAAAGVAASGALASAFGASTFLGSSTLGSAVTGIFVTATPVGWVIGGALAAAAVGYGISRICISGGVNDQRRRQYERALRSEVEKENAAQKAGGGELDEFLGVLQMAVHEEVLELEKSSQILRLVVEAKMEPSLAIMRIRALIAESAKGAV